MPQSERHVYEFGEFRLDATERLLLRKGERLPLTPKVFDTLLKLVEDRGRLIEKDEFMKRLWPGLFVSEDTLAHNISLIRKVLGDGANGQQFIATVAYEVAMLYERIGWLQGENGQRPEALRKLNLALSMFRSAGTRSGNASLPSTVAAVSSIIGFVFEMDGRFQSALACYEQELATFKSRADQDPKDMMARSILSGAYYDVGDTLVKMGRFKDGLARIRIAIALDKGLVSVDPKRGVLRGLLAQHRVAEAEALNKVGDAAGALQSYKEARNLYQSLAELDDLNLDARLNVSATDAKIAATYVRLGRFDEARETYWPALRVSEPPAGRNPPNLQAQYTLADTYSGLGDVAIHLAGRTSHPIEQLSHWREARSWYEKSLGIWRMIPNRSVISPSEFDVGDPDQVAKQLAGSKAAVDKLEKFAATQIN